jgi:nucleoside-diphosphate-sugar epimerase
MKNNVIGTANVVNIALDKRIRKLCHVSSISALGPVRINGFITEESYWQPSYRNSLYAISKFESEREVWRGIAEGLNAVIINPSVIVGPPGTSGESGRLMKVIYRNSAFYTGGINGFVGINDVTNAMISLMESDIQNDRFIISAENLTYRDFISLIAENLERKKPWIKIPSFMLEIVWRLDKIRSSLSGRRPLITSSVSRNARSRNLYSGDKIKKYIQFEYTPVLEAVKVMCELFKRQQVVK